MNYCLLCDTRTPSAFEVKYANDPCPRYACKKHIKWYMTRMKLATIIPLTGKQVRRYNLSLDHKYTLVRVDYLGSLLNGGGSSCENCGKLIVNVATVRTEQGKAYGIGLDCAETLSFVDHNDFWKVKEAEALHAKMMGWVRKLKQAKEAGKIVTANFDKLYNKWIVYYNGVWQLRLTDKTYQAYFKNII